MLLKAAAIPKLFSILNKKLVGEEHAKPIPGTINVGGKEVEIGPVDKCVYCWGTANERNDCCKMWKGQVIKNRLENSGDGRREAFKRSRVGARRSGRSNPRERGGRRDQSKLRGF